jgi:hypothetical protein
MNLQAAVFRSRLILHLHFPLASALCIYNISYPLVSTVADKKSFRLRRSFCTSTIYIYNFSPHSLADYV